MDMFGHVLMCHIFFSLRRGHSYNDFVEALTVVVQHAFAEPCLISQ